MAWISVHEQVIGGKLRTLAKEIGCSQNEALGLLVRLWLWGINNADKEGRIIGAEKEDIAEILTVGIDKRYSPKAAIDALIATNWIDIDDGLFIHDWEKWQEQWYKAIEVRERDAERKRKERRNKRAKSTPTEGMEDVLPSREPINPPQKESKKQTEESNYPKGFEDFWEEYPRKVGKGEAYRKYKARLNDGWSEHELLVAAKNYAAKCMRERTEKQYIKHAKTFLSDATPFTDFIPKNVSSNPASDMSIDDDDPYKDWR